MQFSDSDSSDSSGVTAPQQRLQNKKKLPQHLSAAKSGGLDSTVRAFSGTVSQESPAAQGDSDKSDASPASALRIHVTAGTEGSPMTTATRMRSALPGSDDSDDSDAPHNARSVPASQRAPPFFTKATTAAVSTSAATAAGKPNLKAFRPVQSSSSSSSASSLSLELPGMGKARKRSTTRDAHGAPARGRAAAAAGNRSASASFSASSVASSAASSPVRADAKRAPPSSSTSSSSTSEVVFHKLAVRQQVGAAAATVSHGHARESDAAATFNDPPVVNEAAFSPVSSSVAVAASPQSALDSVGGFPNAPSTLADTSRTNTNLDGSAVMGSATAPSPVSGVMKASASPVAAAPSPPSTAAAPAVLPASPASDASLPTSTSQASASPLPRMATPAMPSSRDVVAPSDFDEPVEAGKDAIEEEEEEDALDSSAASLAAQAALDAAEQRAQADTSPAMSATALHSLSVTPSLAAHSLVPQSQQSPSDFSVPGVETTIQPEDTPRHTDGHDADSSGSAGVDDATVESLPARSRHPPRGSAEVVEGASAETFSSAPVPRRVVPPPPVSSTNTTATHPSHSLMRPDDDDDDDDEDEESGEHGDRSSLSHSDTELTIEQQNAPATVGTFTHATSLERAQAAVGHSTSLLPPTRSSSSSSSIGEGEKDRQPRHKGEGVTNHAAGDVHRAKVRAVALGVDSGSSSSERDSGAHTPVLSPPHHTMERSGTLEEDEPGTLRSIKTIGTASAAAFGEESATMRVKQQHFLHLPSMHGDTHGETQTAALATTATTGEESLSRLSGVLMPPSPSQPRAALSPHASSLSGSSSASNTPLRPLPIAAKVGEQGRSERPQHVDPAAPTHSLPPPPLPDEVVARATETAPRSGLRMAPAPSSSSSSSSSSSASPPEKPVKGSSSGSSSSSGGSVRGDEDKPDAAQAGVVAAGPHQRIRAMPKFSSDDDDGGDDVDDDSKNDHSGRDSAPASNGINAPHDEGETGLVRSRNSTLQTPTPSSSAAASSSSPHAQQPHETVEAHYQEDEEDEEMHAEDVQEYNEEEEEEYEEDNEWANGSGDANTADDPHALQEVGRWDEVLKGMDLLDCTLVSRVYQQTIPHRTNEDSLADDAEATAAENDVCLFKVLSLFPIVASDDRARWSRRTEVQRRLLRLAQDMRDTQRALDEAGLTAAAVEQSDSASHDDDNNKGSTPRGEDGRGGGGRQPSRTTCAGIAAVYVDANCRLIAQLEAEPYMVPLRHLLPATCAVGLQESEILALLRSAVCKTAAMHNAGFVHGSLHSGNILLSSYDGDTVLTQPCGLMSQSAMLPSDLSVISVARACMMASDLRKVWGSRHLHLDAATSARLGTPSRPDTKELVTYHNLAALGWDSRSEGEDDNNGQDEARSSSRRGAAYVPTTADDVYALGMIAFTLYLGIPPFHMTSLWAAVERLGVLAGDYGSAVATTSRQQARHVIAAFCFGERHDADNSAAPASSSSSAAAFAAAMLPPDVLTCGYGALQRRAASHLRPEFEQALQNFVVDCVEASCVDAMRDSSSSSSAGVELHDDGTGCGPHYRTAQDLLDSHPLFRKADAENQSEEAIDAADETMRDTVHRVAYPAFCTWTRAQRDCGSAPHLARLHSNAVYSARCTALFESLANHHTEATDMTSAGQLNAIDAAGQDRGVLSALCPEVAGDLATWQPFFPSVRECPGNPATSPRHDAAENAQDADRAWAAREAAMAAANGDGMSSLLRPSAVAAPAWLAEGHDSPHHHSSRSCSSSSEDDDNDSNGDAAEEAMAAQLFGAPLSNSSTDDDGDFAHYPHLHALVLAGKQSASYGLSRSFLLSRVVKVADTVVLQHLQDCTVTLLGPFRYVVLDDVVRCEVRMGPCEACVLRDVRDCPLIAVAAHHLAGTRVRNTHVSCNGQNDPLPPPLTDSSDVTFSSYGLAYSGLVEDCKRVGLPLEHAAPLRPSLFPRRCRQDARAASAEAEFAATHMRERNVKLLATTASVRALNETGLCLTPEAPYSHALLAYGTRFVHRGDGSAAAGAAGDVFHYFGELSEKDIVVCDVHGTAEPSHDETGASPAPRRRPVVFLHDVLGDVTVERCSFCTIAVVGTPSSLQVVDCHHCQLICMAREAVVEACTQVDCIALVTEYLMVRSCSDVRVRPLFLDCPYSDEVLRRVVMGSLGGQEEGTVVDAYEAGRLDLLNAVLRGIGQGVNVEESTAVTVEDMHYYYQSSSSSSRGESEKWFSVFTVPYEATLCRPSAGSSGSDEAPPSSTSDIMPQAAQALAEHLTLPLFTELLERYEDSADAALSASEGGAGQDGASASHTVRFHDLIDCQVWRRRGALSPVRCAAQMAADAAAQDVTADLTLSDVCVTRVHGGMLCIEDAVKTLRLRRCVGPLDVMVSAAATVVMENCVDVQLRVACIDFRASDCVGCHVALHVNHPPQYLRCTSMETSALDMDVPDYDAALAAAGVDEGVNVFDAPLLLTPSWAPSETVDTPQPSLAPSAIHAYCTGAVAAAPATSCEDAVAVLAALPRGHADDVKVSADHAPLIMALLRQPVTIVAPLLGIALGASEEASAFAKEQERKLAAADQLQPPSRRADVVAVALRALADVTAEYTTVPEWNEGGAEKAAEAETLVKDEEEQREEEEKRSDDGGNYEQDEEAVESDAVVEEAMEETVPTSSSSSVHEETREKEESTVEPVAAEPVVEEPSSTSQQSESDASVAASEKDNVFEEVTADVVNENEVEEQNDEAVEEEERLQPVQVAVAAVVSLAVGDTNTHETVEEKEVTLEAAAEAVMAEPEVPPQLEEETLIATALADTHMTSDSAPIVVSPPTPGTGQRDVAETRTGVAEAAEVLLPPPTHHDPAVASRYDELHPSQRPSSPTSQPHDSTDSFANAGRYSEPLPSQSPVATSLEHSPTVRTATTDRDEYDSVTAMHATTATIAAPIVGMSVDSSVGMPPMAPGPANALAATDVGASAAMDIFHRTFPSPVIAAAVVAHNGGGVAAHRGVATAQAEEEEEDAPVHAYDSLSDPQPTPATESPAAAAAFAAAGQSGIERLRLGVPPLTATVNSFPRDSGDDDWVHSPAVDTPSGSRSPVSEAGRQPTENAATLAARKALPLVSDLTPEMRQRDEGNADSAHETSSSVSDYPHRGVQSCEGSGQRGAGLEDNEPRRLGNARQATNFLHISQDSTSRRGENSLPPSHLAVTGTSPLVSPGEHRTPGSANFLAPAPTPEVVTVHGVDASVKELLRQVEEARQRYERRQQQQQQQQHPTARSPEALEARVKAAVAKLKAAKAAEEVA